MKISVRRAAALAAGSLMVASLVTTTSAPAQAAPTTPVTPEATAAATWLAGQVTNGTLTNVGQKIDFGAGLVATGAAPQQLATLKTQLDAEVPAWANSPTRTAKAAWFYAYAGTPRADLLASVEDSTDNTTGQSAGSQDFSTLALVEGGSAEAPKAVDYLRSGQCSDGGWGYSVPCDGAGDQFATYYSLAALAGIENPSAAVKTDIAEAVAFLGTKQSANGGFKTCTEYNEDFSQCLKEEETPTTPVWRPGRSPGRRDGSRREGGHLARRAPARLAARVRPLLARCRCHLVDRHDLRPGRDRGEPADHGHRRGPGSRWPGLPAREHRRGHRAHRVRRGRQHHAAHDRRPPRR